MFRFGTTKIGLARTRKPAGPAHTRYRCTALFYCIVRVRTAVAFFLSLARVIIIIITIINIIITAIRLERDAWVNG